MITPFSIVLTGHYVRLEPLALQHAENLFAIGQDENAWRYMPRPVMKSLEDTRAWIEETIQLSSMRREIPFAIIRLDQERAAGSTRFLDIQVDNHSLEIGWTWLCKSAQRTAINTESKFLLLSHAFEELDVKRVQFKTDGRNLQSQKAIERLGAVKEGVLRRQRRMWDGYLRDTVYYSILHDEWPEVRERLLKLLR